MKALIIVDVQRDFCEGGRLAVEGGSKVAADISAFLAKHTDEYHVVVATKDWHSAKSTNGGHFKEWPVHCVAETGGSEFQLPLAGYMLDDVFYKGIGKPSFSGFEGETEDGTPLAEYLLARDIDSVDVCGIAFDHCVRATALDAKNKVGLDTRVLLNLTATVSLLGKVETIGEFTNSNIEMLDSTEAF